MWQQRLFNGHLNNKTMQDKDIEKFGRLPLATFKCKKCGKEVDRYGLFIGNICKDCYAIQHEKDTDEQLLSTIKQGFGLK